jgi:hypothetical protein
LSITIVVPFVLATLFVVAFPLCAICAHELKLNKPMHVIKNDFVKKEMDPFENRLKIVEELFDEKNVLV